MGLAIQALPAPGRKAPSSPFQDLPRAETSREFDKGGHETGPARLMAGADAGAGVPVKVLVEEHVVPPVRVGLELLCVPEYGSAPVLVAQEDAGQTRAISWATSKRFICRPEPVGHSTVKSFP